MHAIHKHKKCVTCPGLCCRYMDIPITFSSWTPQPRTWADIDALRWYLLHRGEGSPFAGIFLHDGLYLARFRVPCAHVQSDGKCGVYDSRPWVCRTFDPESGCAKDHPSGEQPFRSILTLDDLYQHAEELGISFTDAPKCAQPTKKGL